MVQTVANGAASAAEPMTPARFGARPRTIAQAKQLGYMGAGAYLVIGTSGIVMYFFVPYAHPTPWLFLSTSTFLVGLITLLVARFGPDHLWPSLYPPAAVALVLYGVFLAPPYLLAAGYPEQAQGTVGYAVVLFFAFYVLRGWLAYTCAALSIAGQGVVEYSSGVAAPGLRLVWLFSFLIVMAVLFNHFSDELENERSAKARAVAELADLNQNLEAKVAAQVDAMVGQMAAHNAEMQKSRARIVAASDESRRQIERNLHDGAQQHLVLMDLKLGLLNREVPADTKAAALASELKSDLAQALAELRDLAHGLFPAILESDGLPAALTAAGERSPLAVSVQSDGVGRLPSEVEAAVYFCCLEAMQNAAKHAGEQATVTVTLRRDNGVLAFSVRDDGEGYDAEAVGASHGLQNMQDRIGALGGTVTVASTPGAGTTVSGSIAV